MYRKNFLNKVLVAVLCIFGLSVSAVNAAQDKDRVLMESPAKDAAVVLKFEGIKDVKTDSYIRKINLNEGLVIRKSRIENGKIIIPPSGLYYTTRTPKSGVLQGDKVLLLGKLYHFVDQGTRLDVIADVEVEKGGSVPFGDGTKVLELSKLAMGANGFVVPNATFKILKQSGNYYGVAFPCETSKKFIDITKGSLANGTGRKTGSYMPGKDGQNFQVEYYGTPVAKSGQTYLVVDEVSAKGAKIKEFGTGALDWLLLTEKDPVEALLGPGEKITVGDYTLEILAVTGNSAKVKLTNTKTNAEMTRELGPVTQELLTYMPVDEVGRQKLLFRPDANDIQVQLNIYKEGGPFEDGKARLAVYYDLMKLENPMKWAGDERFIFRPDT
jgi:hypothetical protein